MTRLAIALALVFPLVWPLVWLLGLAGCFQAHPSGQQELMGTDCVGCHQTDYAATIAPVHRDTPQVFSTTCANCHRTVNWKPALAGLHNDVFVIASGKHAQIACLGCHDLDSGQPSTSGANTNCLACHPNDQALRDGHDGVTTATDAPYQYLASVPNFCLSCHPAGTADVHPDSQFPRTGDHAVTCGKCHDRTAGPDTKGANVTCVDSMCHHTLAASDLIDDHMTTKYTNLKGDGSSRNFCLGCHPPL